MPNGDDHNPDNGRKDGEFDGITFLYIRTHAADDGSVPLPSSLPHWQSPDILIVQPGGAVGTEAIADQPNQVRVTVTNAGGITAVDAYVEVFVANPSTGFTPATATPVGADYVTVPGYTTRTLDLPWTPPASEAGHRCLLARVALWIPPDHYADPTVFDVRGDRHVAQRNIHVLAMGNKSAMRFGFLVVNPFERDARFRLVAREVRAAKAQDMLRQSLGCAFAQFGEGSLEQIRLSLGREKVVTPIRENRMELLHERFEFPTTGVLRAAEAEGRQSVTVNMEPGEVRQAAITVGRNPDTRKGDLHAIDIQLIDEERELVGGLTLIVQH